MTSFWHSGWLSGRRPKDIAPNLFLLSKSKRRKVADALDNDNWIRDINISNGIMTTHLQEYTLLWNLTRQIQLRPGHVGQIRWKFTESGSLGVQSAILRIHQRSAPKLIMAHSFCKNVCGPRTVWRGAWLGAQPRLPIVCHQTLETAKHLLADCRYTRRIWEYISTWAEQPN